MSDEKRIQLIDLLMELKEDAEKHMKELDLENSFTDFKLGLYTEKKIQSIEYLYEDLIWSIGK